ncbi:MAG: alpha/beta hydrolase, partial [Pseudomonadota bacterium]
AADARKSKDRAFAGDLGAVDIAARYPALASSIVLLQAASVDGFMRWKASRDPKKILAKPVIGQLVMKRLAPRRMPDWFGLAVGDQTKLEPFCRCAATTIENGALWSLASAFQIYMDPTMDLPSPPQPILSIWGKKDGSHPPDNVESSKVFSDNLRYVAFDDLGHFSELEDPRRVFDVINGYLEAITGGG